MFLSQRMYFKVPSRFQNLGQTIPPLQLRRPLPQRSPLDFVVREVDSKGLVCEPCQTSNLNSRTLGISFLDLGNLSRQMGVTLCTFAVFVGSVEKGEI